MTLALYSTLLVLLAIAILALTRRLWSRDWTGMDQRGSRVWAALRWLWRERSLLLWHSQLVVYGMAIGLLRHVEPWLSAIVAATGTLAVIEFTRVAVSAVWTVDRAARRKVNAAWDEQFRRWLGQLRADGLLNATDAQIEASIFKSDRLRADELANAEPEVER